MAQHSGPPIGRRLSICGITTKQWTLEEDIRGYKAAGMDGASVWWDKLVSTGVPKAAQVLKDSGLPAPSLVGVPFLLGEADRIDDAAIDGLLGALDACATLGIDRMGVVPGNRHGRSVARMEALTVEVLTRLAGEAAGTGCRARA